MKVTDAQLLALVPGEVLTIRRLNRPHKNAAVQLELKIDGGDVFAVHHLQDAKINENPEIIRESLDQMRAQIVRNAPSDNSFHEDFTKPG